MFNVVVLCKGWCHKSSHDHATIVSSHRFKRSGSVPVYFMSTHPDSRVDSSNSHDSETTDLRSEKDSLWFSSDESKPLTQAQESLQRYVRNIKANLNDGEFSTAEGVECDGEPSVDPSRQVQSVGDSEWMDDW
jgi:hypothetical protein